MTWRGLGPSGQIATLDVGGGKASFKYEFPQGDISGVIDNLLVIGLQGRPISNSVPIFGNVLAFDGVGWSPSAVSGVAGTGVSPHKLLSSEHIDTVAANPTIGDLITGSGSPVSWINLPIGLPGQNLRVSSVGEASWNYDTIQIVTSGLLISLANSARKVVFNKTSGSVSTVNLPISPFLGQEVLIKDGKGDADVFRITVQASGTTIDGFSNIQMRSRYQSMDFMYNGTEWNII